MLFSQIHFISNILYLTANIIKGAVAGSLTNQKFEPFLLSSLLPLYNQALKGPIHRPNNIIEQ